MRIFYDHQIFSFQRFGGISKYFSELLAFLVNHPELDCTPVPGFRSYVNYHLKQKKIWEKEIPFNNPESPFQYWRNYFLNRNFCRKKANDRQYDLIHLTFYDPFFTAFKRRHPEIPLVITIHDMTPELFPKQYSSLYGELVSRSWIQAKHDLAMLADGIIVVSQNTRNDLSRIYGIPEEKLTVIPHGCKPAESFSQTRPWPRPYLLYVGIRGGYKNFTVFLQGAAPILHENPKLDIICIGGGKFTSAEMKLMKKLSVDGQVIQKNVSDQELADFYHYAEFFVYPSRYEGFGLPLLEAFSAECPVLAAQASCFPEIGKDAAVYFPPDAPEILTARLKKYIGDQDWKDKMREKEKSIASSFSIENMARQTANFYRTICPDFR